MGKVNGLKEVHIIKTERDGQDPKIEEIIEVYVPRDNCPRRKLAFNGKVFCAPLNEEECEYLKEYETKEDWNWMVDYNSAQKQVFIECDAKSKEIIFS